MGRPAEQRRSYLLQVSLYNHNSRRKIPLTDIVADEVSISGPHQDLDARFDIAEHGTQSAAAVIAKVFKVVLHIVTTFRVGRLRSDLASDRGLVKVAGVLLWWVRILEAKKVRSASAFCQVFRGKLGLRTRSATSSLNLTYIRWLSDIVVVEVTRVDDRIFDIAQACALCLLTGAGLGGTSQRRALLESRLAAVRHLGVVAVTLARTDQLAVIC